MIIMKKGVKTDTGDCFISLFIILKFFKKGERKKSVLSCDVKSSISAIS